VRCIWLLQGTPEMSIAYGGHRGTLLFSALIRIILTLLRSVLGIILLSDVSFKATYRSVQQISAVHTGLTEMNPGLLNISAVAGSLTESFWWWEPTVLSDGKISKNIAPATCSECTSYFFPGQLSTIAFDTTIPTVNASDFPVATCYVQPDAPGYQIDFAPMTDGDPTITLDDCQLYGDTVGFVAIQLCLKQTGKSLLAGTALVVC
jgi:hypothetical protein